MNKLYFDGQVTDLFAEDYQYLQDTIEYEVGKGFKQMTKSISVASVIKGFVPAIGTPTSTGLTNTGIGVTHITSSGIEGSIVTTNGIIYETLTSFATQKLPSYTAGEWNYICAEYYQIYGSYNKQTKVTAEGITSSIDYANYTLVYDRAIDKCRINLYTSSGYAALTDFTNLVVLGRVKANGAGIPIGPLDTSIESKVTLDIPDESITANKLDPTSLIPQIQIENSTTIDDSYVGTPADLQDDLNKIRKSIKDLKQTSHWDDVITGITASEPALNKLNRKGVLTYLNSLAVSLNGSNNGFIVDTGKIIADDIIVSSLSTSAISMIASENHNIPIETHFMGPVTSTFTLTYHGIQNSPAPVLTHNYGGPVVTFTEGFDYTVDYTTGVITNLVTGTMTNVNVDCTYYYGQNRIDVLCATSSGLQILTGAVDYNGSYDYKPQPPIVVDKYIPLTYYVVPAFATTLTTGDLLDVRDFVPYIRSIREYTSSDLAYTTTAYDRYWVYNKISFTSGGTTLITKGNGWDTSTIGAFTSIDLDAGKYLQYAPYFQENDELWLQLLFPAITATTITINYESVIDSHVLDQTVTLSIPVHAVEITGSMFFVARGFLRGYHRIKISANQTLHIAKIIVGKLDTFYSANEKNIYTDLNISGVTTSVNDTESSSSTTGALVIDGGVGIAKNIHVSGITNADNITDSSSISTGSIVTSGGIGTAKNIYAGGKIHITDNTTAAITSTGSLITTGGIYTAKNIFVGSFTESNATSTGSLLTLGGAGILKNLNVGGTANILGILQEKGFTALKNFNSIAPYVTNLSAGSFTPPSTATWVLFALYGAGGGGGSGGCVSTYSYNYGGGGGGSGSIVLGLLPIALFASNFTTTFGTGGAGGPSNNGYGTNGIDGGDTYLNAFPQFKALGGTGGQNGGNDGGGTTGAGGAGKIVTVGIGGFMYLNGTTGGKGGGLGYAYVGDRSGGGGGGGAGSGFGAVVGGAGTLAPSYPIGGIGGDGGIGGIFSAYTGGKGGNGAGYSGVWHNCTNGASGGLGAGGGGGGSGSSTIYYSGAAGGAGGNGFISVMFF